MQWTEWELTGKLLDNGAALRAILDDTMQLRVALSRSARAEIAEDIQTLGYQLVSLRTVPIAGGGLKAVVEVQPRPLVRSVSVRTDFDISISRPWQPFVTVVLDNEVERRMQLRPGSYLPIDMGERACEVVREKNRLLEYLRDEGFFEAKVSLSIDLHDDASARISVVLELGPEYHLGTITTEQAGGLTLSEEEIREQFLHEGTCLVWKLCFGSARFKRTQHQEDLKRLTRLYQRRGFPAVRIQSLYDPVRSFDRRTKTVNFTLRIDERRHIDVVFEGHDPDRIPDDKLREQLTFDEAGSADDVEAAASAARLTTFLQGRGHFEARVTWRRERFSSVDQIVFRISLGETRRVRSVSFLGNNTLSEGQLTDVIATRPYSSLVRLLGNTPPVSSQQLDDDAGRIVRAYQERGFRHTKVEVAAGPTPESISSVALTTAEISGAQAQGGIHVRFRIAEGNITYLRTVTLRMPRTNEDGTFPTEAEARERQLFLCDQSLGELGKSFGKPIVRTALDRCVAELPTGDAGIPYVEDKVRKANAALGEMLRDQARFRATVDHELIEGDERVDLTFRLTELRRRKVGKILVRGNFRTHKSIILGELGLRENAPLTGDLDDEAQSRLRATGLFDRVDIDYIWGGGPAEGASHAIVQVEERYDSRAQVDLEAGVSTVTNDLSLFGKSRVAMPNLLGRGLYADVAATLGTELLLYEATLRIPRFLLRHLFDAELGAFWREQQTDRFGDLLTKGITVATSRTWQRPEGIGRQARAITTGLRYDFRLRDRRIESIRPAGVDSDESQIPVTTRSGALALIFEWEQRVSRKGSLSPLSPEDGFRLEASVSLASPYFLGQDTFLKLGSSAQVYWPVGERLLLRTDLRYDHGIPLGGEAMLPEVERFFAGGDSTVRGYDEDRLATEVIVEDVPPFGAGKQIRVVAAGGNIRAIASADAQIKIYSALATALFLDAGVVTNDWRIVTSSSIRPGAGMAVRVTTGFGAISLEYAVPLRPREGDDPRGRIHFGFAMRFD